MKIALIDVKGCDDRDIKTSTAMNIRNMVLLSEYLGAKFFYNAKMLMQNSEDFDVLIFGFGGISSNIEQVREFAQKQRPKKVYWLRTEYDSTNPSLYYFCKDSGINYEAIQNMVDTGAKNRFCIGSHFLNLNLLIVKAPLKGLKKKYDCIYYSRWRPDRKEYLKKYLKEDMYFSSDSKNFKKHKAIGCNPKWIEKLSWEKGKETLSLFRYSLYIEDKYTHRFFNNLANRWYESGFCENVVFFDRSCLGTFMKSEIGKFSDEAKYYLVDNYKELQDKIKECNLDFDKHLAIQRNWRASEMDDKNKLLTAIKKIISEGFFGK
jgi:hypothetical protein